jgi:hypothetical protein
MTRRHLIPLTLVSLFVLGVSGCGSPDSDTADTSAPAATTSAVADEHDGHHHGDDDQDAAKSDMEKMTEQLASLSAEDRASAMKQHVCPVSGEMLGTMGVPEKVDVNGQAVWICCDGCKDKLLAEPDKYLAKLKE